MIRKRKQRAHGDTVLAGFVFLDLLDADADALAQIGLAHAKLLAEAAQSLTERDVGCRALSRSMVYNHGVLPFR